MSEKPLNRFGLDDRALPDAVGTECKFCSCDGLHWEKPRGEHNRAEWMLIDEDGEPHDCRAGSADDFEDLDDIDG